MRIKVEVGPTAEPVTVDEARLFARAHDADTPLLDLLIRAGRHAVERETGRGLLQQDVAVWLDAEEARTLAEGVDVLLAPVQSIQSVTAYDTNDAASTLTAANYRLSPGETCRLCLAANATLPTDLRPFDAMKFLVRVGYAANAVPQPLKLGILRYVATQYEHREDAVAGTVAAALPTDVIAVCAPFRIWWL